MKKIRPFIAFIVLIISLLAFNGCTENQRVRYYGGTGTENLPAGQKLVNVTWKEEHLWMLVRPMRPDEKPETYEFAEKSSFGIIQGKFVIVEKR